MLLCRRGGRYRKENYYMQKFFRLIAAALAGFGILAGAAVVSSRPAEAAVTIYNNTSMSSLTTKQKNIANSLMNNVKKSSKQLITLNYDCSVGDFQKAWNAVNDTYFRYYSVIHLNAYRRYKVGSNATVGVRVQLYVKDSRKRYNRHLANKAKLQSIAKSVTQGKSTVKKKVLAINNYVCKKLTYRENSGTLDVALRTKYAKCTGYATLFMALCEQCGISCCQIAGYANGGHDWNQVKIGNTWYYIDPTWNDASNNAYGLNEKLWSNHTMWAKIYIINFKRCGYTFGL